MLQFLFHRGGFLSSNFISLISIPGCCWSDPTPIGSIHVTYLYTFTIKKTTRTCTFPVHPAMGHKKWTARKKTHILLIWFRNPISNQPPGIYKENLGIFMGISTTNLPLPQLIEWVLPRFLEPPSNGSTEASRISVEAGGHRDPRRWKPARFFRTVGRCNGVKHERFIFKKLPNVISDLYIYIYDIWDIWSQVSSSNWSCRVTEFRILPGESGWFSGRFFCALEASTVADAKSQPLTEWIYPKRSHPSILIRSIPVGWVLLLQLSAQSLLWGVRTWRWIQS